MKLCDECSAFAEARFLEPNGRIHSVLCNECAREMFSGWCCGMGCDNCKQDPLNRLRSEKIETA